jgi:hypothetical protein
MEKSCGVGDFLGGGAAGFVASSPLPPSPFLCRHCDGEGGVLRRRQMFGSPAAGRRGLDWPRARCDEKGGF